MTTLDRISALIKNGAEGKFLALVESLESISKLPKELVDKLNGLGNNPIEEPLIYEALISNEIMTAALNVLSEDEIKLYPAVTIGHFIQAVAMRIKDYKYPDGTFKFTPRTEECRLPNFIESDTLRKLFLKQSDLMTLIQKATGEDKEQAIRDYMDSNTEIQNKVAEVSGIDFESLTDWEKGLVLNQISITMTNAFMSAQGKPYAI